MGAGMRPSRWQWGTTAWAVRRQPYPTMGTDSQCGSEFAAAFETFFEELAPFRDAASSSAASSWVGSDF